MKNTRSPLDSECVPPQAQPVLFHMLSPPSAGMSSSFDLSSLTLRTLRFLEDVRRVKAWVGVEGISEILRGEGRDPYVICSVCSIRCVSSMGEGEVGSKG